MRRALAACLLVAAIAAAAPRAGASNDSLFDQQWGLSKVRAPQAWSVATGHGVVIAVIDSGVDLQHADLKSKLVPGFNTVNPGQPPQDDCGHGTHVAGIAAASTSNGLGVAGVAPGAKIMPVRVLASSGDGCGGSDAATGIRWAADHGARVINMSFGEDAQALFGPSFSDAIRYAWSKGAIPVVSAGNEFILSSGFADEPALVVAATNRSDNKPLYSSGVGSAQWGISAPGGAGSVLGGGDSTNDILSTYFDPSTPTNHNRYATMAGTSMAAPFVSGAAAVLLSMGLTKEQVVQRLLSTADDLGSPGTFGHGRVNLERAVRAGSGPSSQPSPTSGTRSTADPATPAVRSPNGSTTRNRSDATPSTAPASAVTVETPPNSPSADSSYAAPRPTPAEPARSPMLAVAAGLFGLASASVGFWTLYRFRRAS